MKKLSKIILKIKILCYKRISNCKSVIGKPKIIQPALFLGKGKIIFDGKSSLGYFPSPNFYSGYAHIEARQENSQIKIGKNCKINNNFTAVANEGSIIIGDDCLFGTNIELINSDFHHIEPEKRHSGNPFSKDIIIGNNVWVGNSAKILKGVNIGDNSVVAAGSVVVKDVESNVVVAGNPAKEIKKL